MPQPPTGRPRPAPQTIAITVVRPGSCHARTQSGDAVFVVGAELRIPNRATMCALAVGELMPFVRHLQSQKRLGFSALPLTVSCNACPKRNQPAQFRVECFTPQKRRGGTPPELSKAVEKLKRYEVLKPLPNASLQRLAARVKRGVVPRGMVILQRGMRGERMFLVERGRVEVLDETEEVVATIESGDCFGEIALLTGEPVSATIRSATQVELLQIEGADFRELLVRNPGLHFYFSRLLQERLETPDKVTAATTMVASGMAGQLADFSPPDLVQALHLTKRSGKLRVKRDDAVVSIVFADGQPWTIEAEGLEISDPEEIFFDMLTWTEGSFRFGLCGKIERTFFKDMTTLLLEGMRRIDEAAIGLSDG